MGKADNPTCYWLCLFRLTLLLMIGQEEGIEREEALMWIHPETDKYFLLSSTYFTSSHLMARSPQVA